MTVEAATYISGLNIALPPSNDPKSEGDDHLRLIKSVLKATFPNANAPITITAAQLNDAFLKSSGGVQDVWVATAFHQPVTLGANGALSMPLYFNANGYNPSMRTNSGLPGFEWINSANNAAIMTLNDGGVLNVVNTLYAHAEIQWVASNGYYARARADTAGLWGLINQAGNQWNLQVWDAGFWQFRNSSVAAINVISGIGGDPNALQTTIGAGYIKINEINNGAYIDFAHTRDQDYRWRIMYDSPNDRLDFYSRAGPSIAFSNNSDIYCSGFGWVWGAINGKTPIGSQCQWATGSGGTETPTGNPGGGQTCDLGSPWVGSGLRFGGGGATWTWLRGTWLRTANG